MAKPVNYKRDQLSINNEISWTGDKFLQDNTERFSAGCWMNKLPVVMSVTARLKINTL